MSVIIKLVWLLVVVESHQPSMPTLLPSIL